MKTSHVTTDMSKNMLNVNIVGFLSKKDLDRLYTDIRFCVADLSPGFDVVSDFSSCSCAAVNGIPTFRKIMHYLIDKRVRSIVRIVDKERVIFHQLLNLSFRLQGYCCSVVSSLEEAERELQIIEKRAALRYYLYRQPVKYSMNGSTLAGFIHDISIGGCAVTSSSEYPAVGDTGTVAILFKEHNELLSFFEAEVRVVSVREDCFSVQFSNLSAVEKEALHQRLIYESQCEISALEKRSN